MEILGVIVGIIILLIMFFIVSYNKIIRLIQNAKDSDAEISIQLDRREKIFKSMLSVVKKYMDHEKSTLAEVIKMRSGITDNTSKEERMNIESQISGMLPSMNLQFEAYPDLKANTNMIEFQREISNTENKLSYAKSAYNESVKEIDSKRQSFPTNMIVGMFQNLQEKFPYWKLSEEAKAKKENYTVDFD